MNEKQKTNRNIYKKLIEKEKNLCTNSPLPKINMFGKNNVFKSKKMHFPSFRLIPIYDKRHTHHTYTTHMKNYI